MAFSALHKSIVDKTLATTSNFSTNTTSSAHSSKETSQGPETNDRNLQLALQHATLLQQRKDAESSILSALEELIEFPTTSESRATRPSQADIYHFTELINLFQASDYDDLIEERNCAEKCGYVFCPNKLRRTVTGGNYSRIVRGHHDQGLKVVPSSQYKKWCSKWCERAALFVKVQLSELPVWERATNRTSKVVIFSEQTFTELASEISQVNPSKKDDKEVRELMKELAVERGDKPEVTRPLFSLPLREKPPGSVSAPQAPTLDEEGQERTIEGHFARDPALVRGTKQGTSNFREEDGDEDDDEEQDEDQDWDLS